MRRNYQKAKPQTPKKIFKSNEQILSPQVSVIDENGNHLGVMLTVDAIARAKELDLDLVEVNPMAEVPVAKIVDLGQLKYEHEKKMHRQKVQQKKIDVKSIRLSFRIGQNDLDIRANQAIKFLKGDDKVKVELMLRGRERQHFDRARELMLEFVNIIKNSPDLHVFEEQVLTRQPSGFSMILANKK
jgi:translation initiation factor IF-3